MGPKLYPVLLTSFERARSFYLFDLKMNFQFRQVIWSQEVSSQILLPKVAACQLKADENLRIYAVEIYQNCMKSIGKKFRYNCNWKPDRKMWVL